MSDHQAGAIEAMAKRWERRLREGSGITYDPMQAGMTMQLRECLDELIAESAPAAELAAELAAERTARKALVEALWRSNHDCCNVGHTHSDHHGYDDPCPVEARIVAALTLAAKLP